MYTRITPTKRQRCLAVLRRCGAEGATIGDFLQAGVGTRYGSRIDELRNEGHTISYTRRTGLYHLTRDADYLPAPGPMNKPSIGEATPAQLTIYGEEAA